MVFPIVLYIISAVIWFAVGIIRIISYIKYGDIGQIVTAILNFICGVLHVILVLFIINL